MKKFYPLFYMLLLVSSMAFCQSKNRISFTVDSATIDDVVNIIERQTEYSVFYNLADFDSVFFTNTFQNKSLSEVLSKLFENTDYKYSTYSDNQIFITKEISIITTLPPDFFNEQARVVEKTESNVPEFDFIAHDQEKLKQEETRLYEIGNKASTDLSGYASLAGIVKDQDTGEPVIGAVVYIEEPRIGGITDQFGYYSISIPKGRHELNISSIGMKGTKRRIMLYSNGKLDIELKEDVIPLREIVVESDRDANVMGMNMGVERLDIKTLKQIPTAFGETDILKIALTLPGVQSVGENTTGLNVRGGATDQNLILYNDATIYNPSHLFGFFSAFNPDMLKNVELFKSGIPANYGGRLSSVLDITTREGNKKKFTGSGGIGSLTTHLTLEGPIIKDKLSIIAGGRTTYSDWLLRYVPDDGIKNSQASFYDINLHASYELNDNNNIYVTGYYSDDRFRLNSDTLYAYHNKALNVKWKHLFNNKLYGVFTSGFSGYDYSVESNENAVNAFILNYNLNQYDFKVDLSYFHNSTHNFDFGISSIYYDIDPGNYLPNSPESLVEPIHIQTENGLENAIYVGDKIEVSSRLSFYLGLRYSMFSALGPRKIFGYPEGVPKNEDNIIDTVSYGRGPINTYHGPEYRASVRYLLATDLSVKLSVNRLRQYIHMLSNTTVVSPTDLWKLSDKNIKPQVGDQISIGLYKDFRVSAISASIEAYYKRSSNYLDYKSGAELILNDHIETDVVGTEGKAYGVEVMVKRDKGKINGWMSYTYSRSMLSVDSESELVAINNGEYYPSNHDKPHDFTLVGNYKFNRRVNIGLNFTYSTGRPITLPLSKYVIDDSKRVYYSERNQFRIPDYIRVDLSLNVEGNHRIKKLAHSSWTFAVYNLLGRKNPYSIYFISENGNIYGYKLSIFGSAIPTITYNFRF